MTLDVAMMVIVFIPGDVEFKLTIRRSVVLWLAESSLNIAMLQERGNPLVEAIVRFEFSCIV